MTGGVRDMVATKAGGKRHEVSRSRAGCLTCRGRHIRCDEGQPDCKNCLTSRRKCKYLATGEPIQDRRLQGKGLLPGQQAPWLARNDIDISSGQLARDSALDPFDVLPISMPYKSKHLLQYFYHFGTSNRMNLKGFQAFDCLPVATTDEHALRSTLLIASLHYSWNMASMHDFHSAFLFHKLDSIRYVNNWLDHPDPKTVMLCVKQICTLCLTEVCQGNVAAADAHLQGIINFLDVMEKQNFTSVAANDLDTELANRYIVLTYNFVHLLKSRLNDFILFRSGEAASPFWDEFSPNALVLMKKWHTIEFLGLVNRLKAIRLMPYFFCPLPPTSRLKDINASLFVDSLRRMTGIVNQRNKEPEAPRDNQVWDEGAPNRMFLHFVHGHISSCLKEDKSSPFSLSGEKSDEDCLPSSWSGVATASGMYMHSVLNIANVEDPIDPRLMRRLAMIMKRDLDQTVDDMKGEHGRNMQDFWFWKSFTTYMALAINQRDLQHEQTAWSTSPEDMAWDLRSILDYMESKTRAWSEVTGTTHWQDAKTALLRLVWATSWSDKQESFAEALWNRAVWVPATT